MDWKGSKALEVFSYMVERLLKEILCLASGSQTSEL